MKNLTNSFILLLLGMSFGAFAGTSGLDLDLKINNYAASSVCEHLPLMERIGCKMDLASADSSHIRVYVGTLTESELRPEESSCLQEQVEEIEKAFDDLKHDGTVKKKSGLKIDLRYYVVREDDDRTIRKVMVDKTAVYPGINPCNNEKSCIEGSYWTESQRCRLFRAYDIVERFKTKK